MAQLLFEVDNKNPTAQRATAAGPLLPNLPLICQALLSLWKSGLQ